MDYKTNDGRFVRREFAFTTATHVTQSTTWWWTCVPVASHLNHDGRHNGITRVQAVGDGYALGTLVDVGTRTLSEIPETTD
jgi:hypothetical protein